MKNILFALILLLNVLLPAAEAFAQANSYGVSGEVVDKQTGEPLAFVNIIIDGTRQGGMTGIDGRFEISHNQPIERLHLSYVGYSNKMFDIPEKKVNVLIGMERQAIQLEAVEVFPGENPAHRIIQNAINNRNRNNPERRTSFSYTSYNKFIFTGDFQDDSSLTGAAGPDTISARLERHLEDHHFMIMETITQRKFLYPNRNNETILASRVSGLENPLLALMVSQFQSFSFYDDYINISDNSYLSPLSPGSLNRYFFLLEDTTYTTTDTTFIISYRPSRGRNFNGLQGVLYINSNGWAVQNVIAEPYPPKEDTRIRIQQKYELIDSQHWFPTQLLTDVEFFGISDPANFKMLGHGRTYISDITIDPPLRRRDFSAFDIEFSPESVIRDERFWNYYRINELSQRERNTYHRMDSLGRARNLDRTVDRLEALFSGYWRQGIFDIDILESIGHNEVEGFRPGFGFKTNRGLSNLFSLNAHVGYGFKDDMIKYGAGAEMMVFRPLDLKLGAHYQYDRFEKGTPTLLSNGGLLDPHALRAFFLRDVDMVERKQAWLQWRIIGNNAFLRAFAQKDDWEIMGKYIFNPDPSTPGAFTRRFNTFETGLMVNYAPGQRFVLAPERLLTYGKDYPQYLVTFQKGWDNIAGGQFDYYKADMQIVAPFRIRMAGTQRWVLQGGITWGDTPWHKLYNAPAAYRKFSISIPQAFATMRMDEFFSNKYMALFFTHNFGSLLWRTPNFEPQLVLLTSIAIGELDSDEKHLNVSLQSFPKGYFESGVAALNLLGSGFSGIGLEFMYRYGPYSFPTFSDNFSLRLSYSVLF